MRFQPFQEEIRGNFEKYVWNEEYCERDVPLIAHKVQVFRQIHGKRIRYIDTTEKLALLRKGLAVICLLADPRKLLRRR